MPNPKIQHFHCVMLEKKPVQKSKSHSFLKLLDLSQGSMQNP